MSTTICPHEDAVADAARSGDWSDELKIHRDSCLTCAELTLVVAALAVDAEELAAIEAPLPDPAPIWLRARLVSRELDFQRATRAIVWVQRAAVAVALGIGIAFAPGLWSFLGGLFSGFELSLSAPNLPRAAGSPVLVLVGSILVLGGLALWELMLAQEN
jgi:hypothetical protein